jgi:hypothetical protein
MNNLGSYYNEHGLRRSSRVNKPKSPPKNKSPTAQSARKPSSPPAQSARKPSSPPAQSARKPSSPPAQSPRKPSSPPAQSARKPSSPPAQSARKPSSLTPQSPRKSNTPTMHPTRDSKSASPSPIYKRKATTSISDRLDKYRHLQSIKDIKYYLNIKKSFVKKIENKATGIACLSNNSELTLDNKKLTNFRFAIKIAENIKNDSVKEIFILEKMLDFVKKGYQNLPIIYNSFNKLQKSYIINNMNPNIEVENFELIKSFFKSNKNYNVYINELANGDLEKFLSLYDKVDSEITEDILLNAVSQILMSIATLHSLGISHHDTHHGNFLYHKINPGGYIKYTIGTESYYIKNLGYLWVIWDFGISFQIYNPEMEFLYDYEMLSLYLRKDEGKYNMHFIAKNADEKIVRRKHGHLKFENNPIPVGLIAITDLIYRFSIYNKIKPDVPMDYGNILLLPKTKNLSPEQRKELMNLSTPNYILYDDQRRVIDEATFITKIIELLPSVIEKRDNVDVNDILFDISLDFEKIDFVREPHENGRRIINYDETIKKYHGRKIILPEIK